MNEFITYINTKINEVSKDNIRLILAKDGKNLVVSHLEYNKNSIDVISKKGLANNYTSLDLLKKELYFRLPIAKLDFNLDV